MVGAGQGSTVLHVFVSRLWFHYAFGHLIQTYGSEVCPH